MKITFQVAFQSVALVEVEIRGDGMRELEANVLSVPSIQIATTPVSTDDSEHLKSITEEGMKFVNEMLTLVMLRQASANLKARTDAHGVETTGVDTKSKLPAVSLDESEDEDEGGGGLLQ